jgi:predicted phage terminase large subunit-like protein
MSPEVEPELRKWEPNPGPQFQFLSSSAYELLYGGAAGGGKSEGLLMGALRHVDKPWYRALLLRRTFPELQRSLIERSKLWYEDIGGEYNEQKKLWRFPSGAVIEFGHLEYYRDVHQYQSAEYQFLGFDELTSFEERMYTYMLSRLRSAKGIPIRVRSCTNPGGEGHEWVFRRWAPWLDTRPEYEGPRAKSNEVLFYRNTDGGGEEWTERGPGALSRVFIGAKVQDNRHLMENDPEYVTRLGGLDLVTRLQLRDGNWLVKPAAGLLFKRAWFKWLDARPAEVSARVRRWDLASTEPHENNKDPDWTIGALMSRTLESTYAIENVVRRRVRPAEVEATIKATAELDGRGVDIWIPEDPGQAGKAQSAAYAKLLAGFNVQFIRETGDKMTRAKPFSAQVEAGNVYIVRGAWNEPFVESHEMFPTPGVHDDDVDAASGAFTALCDDGTDAYINAMKQARTGGRT